MKHSATENSLNSQQLPVSNAEKARALPWSLAAAFLNTLFALWTFGGSVFLLFLSEIGMPKAQIGIILSLFPFCGLLALGMAPVAASLGRKRVFLFGYGTRKFVMAGLLLLPATIAFGGRTMGLILLCVIISIFAILRAIAETAYYPWLQEFVPDQQRGKYNGSIALLGMIASVVAVLVAGWVIGAGSGLARFNILIGAGCIAGLLGVAAMVWVPGGRPVSETASDSHLRNMVAALRDRNLLSFLAGLGAITIGCLFLTSFLPLFVKEQLGVPAGTVVMLDTAVMVGGGLSSFFWGWLADRVGSRPVLLPAIVLCLLVPVGWMLLPRESTHVLRWCIVLYGAFGVANGGITVATIRLLFNGVIPTDKSTAYTAIYYAWAGITGGLAPLLAGGILSAHWRGQLGALDIDAYTLLFALCLLCLIIGWACYCLVAPDDRYTTRALLRRIFRSNSNNARRA